MTGEIIAEIAKALSEPKRVDILESLQQTAVQCDDYQCCDLSEKCCNVGDLSSKLDLAISTTSYHLRELRRAGLVKTSKRGTQVFVELDFGTFHDLGEYFISFLDILKAKQKE